VTYQLGARGRVIPTRRTIPPIPVSAGVMWCGCIPGSPSVGLTCSLRTRMTCPARSVIRNGPAKDKRGTIEHRAAVPLRPVARPGGGSWRPPT